MMMANTIRKHIILISLSIDAGILVMPTYMRCAIQSDESEVEDAEEEMKANKKRGSFLRRAGKKSVSAPLQVSKKEEARRLSSVQTKIGSQANVANDGAEVDPERQIGHIGSQYVPEAVVPEWMKKRVSKASF